MCHLYVKVEVVIHVSEIDISIDIFRTLFLVSLINTLVLFFRSRRWHTQRCVENSITKNTIGLPLHTDEKDTDLDLAAKQRC